MLTLACTRGRSTRCVCVRYLQGAKRVVLKIEYGCGVQGLGLKIESTLQCKVKIKIPIILYSPLPIDLEFCIILCICTCSYNDNQAFNFTYNWHIFKTMHWGAGCLALRTRNGSLKELFVPKGTLPTHPDCSPSLWTCYIIIIFSMMGLFYDLHMQCRS